MLTLPQARREARWLNFLGWSVGSLCMLLLVVAMLKGIHTVSVASTTGVAGALAAPFRRAIEALVAIPWNLAPTITDFIWWVAPDLHLGGPLLSSDNASFFGVYFLLLLSMLPRGRAIRLKRAIAEHEQRMQQIYWEETAREAFRAGVSRADIEHKLDVRVSIQNQKAPWHTRLIGVVILGIVLPLIVEVLKVVVGLAKLP